MACHVISAVGHNYIHLWWPRVSAAIVTSAHSTPGLVSCTVAEFVAFVFAVLE